MITYPSLFRWPLSQSFGSDTAFFCPWCYSYWAASAFYVDAYAADDVGDAGDRMILMRWFVEYVWCMWVGWKCSHKSILFPNSCHSYLCVLICLAKTAPLTGEFSFAWLPSPLSKASEEFMSFSQSSCDCSVWGIIESTVFGPAASWVCGSCVVTYTVSLPDLAVPYKERDGESVSDISRPRCVAWPNFWRRRLLLCPGSLWMKTAIRHSYSAWPNHLSINYQDTGIISQYLDFESLVLFSCKCSGNVGSIYIYNIIQYNII